MSKRKSSSSAAIPATVTLSTAELLGLLTEAGALAVTGALSRILAQMGAQKVTNESARRGSRPRVDQQATQSATNQSTTSARGSRSTASTSASARVGQTRSVGLVRTPREVAPDGLAVAISTANEGRTRLPKALFDAGEGEVYPFIVLIDPEGNEREVSCDAEGRSRVNSSVFGESAHVGQVAQFEETEPGVFQIVLRDAYVDAKADARRENGNGGAHGSRVGHAQSTRRSLDDAFDAPEQTTRARGSRPRTDQQTAKKTGKRREPTEAQKAAWERFTTQNRVVKCGKCGSRVKIGETVETTTGERMCDECFRKKGNRAQQQHSDARARRQQAPKPTAREDARAQVAALTRGRKPEEGTNWVKVDKGEFGKALAQTHAGISDETARIERMRATLARRRGQQ